MWDFSIFMLYICSIIFILILFLWCHIMSNRQGLFLLSILQAGRLHPNIGEYVGQMVVLSSDLFRNWRISVILGKTSLHKNACTCAKIPPGGAVLQERTMQICLVFFMTSYTLKNVHVIFSTSLKICKFYKGSET